MNVLAALVAVCAAAALVARRRRRRPPAGRTAPVLTTWSAAGPVDAHGVPVPPYIAAGIAQAEDWANAHTSHD